MAARPAAVPAPVPPVVDLVARVPVLFAAAPDLLAVDLLAVDVLAVDLAGVERPDLVVAVGALAADVLAVVRRPLAAPPEVAVVPATFVVLARPLAAGLTGFAPAAAALAGALADRRPRVPAGEAVVADAAAARVRPPAAVPAGLPERGAPAGNFGSLVAPLTTSLKLLPGRNFGTAVFFTFTVAPVAGLRAVRAARSWRSKTPKPVIATFSPLATARVIVSTTASTARPATLRSLSMRSVMASISSALFTASLRGSLSRLDVSTFSAR